MVGEGSFVMVSRQKTFVGGNLKTHKPNITKTRSQKINQEINRADKSGPLPPVRNQNGVEKYDVGTNSSPKHPGCP